MSTIEEDPKNTKVIQRGKRYIEIRTLLNQVGGMDSENINKIAFWIWETEMYDESSKDYDFTKEQ